MTHVHGCHNVLSSRDHDTSNDRVVRGSQNSHGSEEVLPASLQSGKQSTDQVAGHEDLGQLVVVLVVGPPDTVSLSVKAAMKRDSARVRGARCESSFNSLLEEVLHSLGTVRVGVHSLPVLQVEG